MVFKMKLVWVMLLLMLLCEGHKILIITSSVGCASHSLYFNLIAVELVNRGNNVTFLFNSKNISSVEVEQHEISRVNSIPNMYNLDLRSEVFKLKEFVTDLVTSFYENRYLAELVREPLDPATGSAKFDLVLLDSTYSEPLLPLVHALRAPFILVSPTHSMLSNAWNFNVPLPYAHYNYFGFKKPMNYFGRLVNGVANYAYVLFFNYVVLPAEQSEVGKYMINAPPLLEIYQNASMVFLSQNPLWQESLPSMPFIVDVGCIQCRPAQPLPPSLEKLVSSAGNAGVIYFSFGTLVKKDWLPEVLMTKIIEALSGLPQLIIWNTDYNATLPSNFRHVTWVPQQDLIAHPATRLFVNHAGLNSIQEAIYHACPVLSFPFCCDMYYAANQVVANGNGEVVDWKTVTVDELRSIVRALINNEKYKMAAERASRVSRDTLATPSQTAVYWIEYVIRHKGARHLKDNLSLTRLSTFQLKLIDVLIVLVLISILVVLFLKLFYKLILSCFKTVFVSNFILISFFQI